MLNGGRQKERRKRWMKYIPVDGKWRKVKGKEGRDG